MAKVGPMGVIPEAVTVSGWGRTNSAHCYSVSPRAIDEVTHAMTRHTTIARGRGRSYGDAAQNSGALVLDTRNMAVIQPIDPSTGDVVVGGGVTIDQLLRRCVPNGWFVPVTPGTRQVTIGGAIAADIHGKNHHRGGSFCNHVRSITVRTGRALETLSPETTPAEFWTTAGGMGLTGIIIEATLRLIPIETSFIASTTDRYPNLDSLMGALRSADRDATYTVAWIDTLNPNDKLGRGVLITGEHATRSQLQNLKRQAEPLRFTPHSISLPNAAVPLLSPTTGRIFNSLWYRINRPGNRVETIGSFFHPLDAIDNWNLLYGPRGFLQWQIVVPDSAAPLIGDALQQLASIGAGSFLSILKRLGPGNPGPLSFPIPGWTLAIDLPLASPSLRRVLNDLDRQVVDVGGRVYLAKDARLDPALLAPMYPRLNEWRHVRANMDPNNRFRSDLGRRLNLNQIATREQTA